MKKFLLVILLAFNCFALQSQITPFAKVFYDPTMSGLRANGVVSDNDTGSFIVVGEDNSHNAGLVAKFDTAGNQLWIKSFKSQVNSSGYARLNSIIHSYDTCFVIVGTALDSTTGHGAAVITKIKSNGDTLWTRLIGKTNSSVEAFSVTETLDSGYVLVGNSQLSVSPYSNTIFIARINKTGSLLWSNFFTTSGAGYSVKQCADSSFILLGSTSNHGFMIRFSKAGTMLWTKNYFDTSSSSNQIALFDVVVTPTGFYTYGCANSSLLFLKTDFNGSILWQKTYNASGIYGTPNGPSVHLLKKTSNQYYGMAGSCTGSTFFSADSSGNLIWSKGPFLEAAGIVFAKDSGFVLLGNGPFCGVRSTSSNITSPQIAIIKTDTAGNSPDCSYTGGSNLYVTPIAISNPTYTVSTAATIKSVYLHGGTVTSVSYTGCIGATGNVKENTKINLSVFPNPAYDKITVTCQTQGNKTAQMFDVTGEKVKEIDFSAQETELNMRDLSNGIYLLRLKTSDGTESRKIISLH